jgi:8-oxo-dGTP pyrophosphatase MutT (NUDIX family)
VSDARVSLVDVYVLRGSGAALECLVLRRAPAGRCAGSWESVHGHIEAGERPEAAALREMREETGLDPTRLYNLSRVESFYLHGSGEVALIPAFAAFVPAEAIATTGTEHDAAEWLPVSAARGRMAWPRERRALDDIVVLFGDGGAGPLEDVLRICR